MDEKTTSAASSAASAAAKLGGIGAAAVGAWTLQDWSLAAAILSSIVAIVAGVIYSIKMVIEIYWLNRVRRSEVKHLEKETS